MKLARKLFPVTNGFVGDNFFVRRDNVLWATPLFLVVVMIEGTDLIFAVDSIPAVLSISEDALIVYTSNVFAILRIAFIVICATRRNRRNIFSSSNMDCLLSFVFVGVKMCITDLYKIPLRSP